jgi:hypothetical protein
METIETIEDALASHEAWIARFKQRIASGKPVSFDPVNVRSAEACKFGAWFASPSSLDLLGKEKHKMAASLHGTFHELAYHASLMSSLEISGRELRELTENLEEISKQLCKVLEVERRRKLA